MGRVLFLIGGISICFNVNAWLKREIGSGENPFKDVVVRDIDGDGRDEVYVAEHGGRVLKFTYQQDGWQVDTIATFSTGVGKLGVADVDENGNLELYASVEGGGIYRIRYISGSSVWNVDEVGSGKAGYFLDLAVGDANNDGVVDICGGDGTNGDYWDYGVIYYWNLSGTEWSESRIDTIGDNTGSTNPCHVIELTCGDGNNDGSYEFYTAYSDSELVQYSFTGSWGSTNLLTGRRFYSLVVGDGDNNTTLELYGGADDNFVYQFQATAEGWNITQIGGGTAIVHDIIIGEGDEVSGEELYIACADGKVYQIKMEGGWQVSTVEELGSPCLGIAIGNADNNRVEDLYVVTQEGKLWQIMVRYPGPVFYVSPTGNDDTGDGSEAKPWRSITKAMTQVREGDTILVLKGEYNYTSETFPIEMKDSINLIGEDKDSTIIDGGSTQRLFTVNNGEEITIQNFTLQGGNAPSGGVIFATSSTLTLKGNKIINNQANTGVVYGEGGEIVLIGNEIGNNQALDMGIVYITGGGTLRLENNRIINNISSNAAPIVGVEAELIIRENLIKGNEGGYGGGIYVNSCTTNMVRNLVVRNVSSETRPGAIYGVGGKISITENTIVDNYGSIYLYTPEGEADATLNSIYYNKIGEYEVRNNWSNLINLGNNYWKTTDSTSIQNSILGLANISPIRGEASSGAPTEPSSILDMKVYKDKYYTSIAQSAKVGDTLYVEIDGVDVHSSLIEYCVVLVRSDREAVPIRVAVVETDTASGNYRGEVVVRNSNSNDLANVIGVNYGGRIFLSPESAPSIEDTIPVLATSPVMSGLPDYTPGTTREVRWNKCGWRYYVECSIDSTFSTINESSDWIEDTFYTFTNLGDGVRYFYRVKAKSMNEVETNYSNVVASTQDNSLPIIVAIHPPNDSAVGTVTPTIWVKYKDNTSGVNVGEVRLFMNEGEVTSFATRNETLITYTPEDPLEGDTFYVMEVRVTDNVGFSVSRSWTFHIDVISPTAPTLLVPANLSIVQDSVPTFSWEGVSFGGNFSNTIRSPTPVKYQLECSYDDGFNNLVLEVKDIEVPYYIPLTPLRDTVYYWRVMAYDLAGNSSPYSEVYRFEIDAHKPDKPEIIFPKGGIKDTIITFRWGEVVFRGNVNVRATPVRYTVQCATSITFAQPTLIFDTTGLEQTSFTPTYIFGEGIYFWRVEAYDLAGWRSGFTSPTQFEVDYTLPSLPTIVLPDDSSWTEDNTPLFIWREVEEDMKYEIEISKDVYFTDLIVDTIVTDTTFTPSTSLVDGYYFWRVRSVDVSNNTSPYTTIRLLEIDSEPPPIPQVIYPPDSMFLSDNTPPLVWHSVEEESIRYGLQLSVDSFFISPLINIVLEDTFFIPSSSLSDTVYYWRVSAIDKHDHTSGFTRKYTFIIDTQAPSIPVLIAPAESSVVKDNTPTFRWSEVTSPLNVIEEVKGSPVTYVFQCAMDQAFANIVINETNITTNSFTPTFPLSDTIYYWRVEAVDGVGQRSGFSLPFVLIVNANPPEAPQLLLPQNNSLTNDTLPLFVWSEPMEAVKYLLQCGQDVFFSSLVIDTIVEDTFFTPTQKLVDTTYYWRVRAYDQHDNYSDFSVIFKFRIDSKPPRVPALVFPEDSTVTEDPLVSFAWEDVSDEGSEIRYTLQCARDSTFSDIVFEETNLDTNVYTLTSPLEDTLYYWRVNAYDLAGNESGYSDFFRLIVKTYAQMDLRVLLQGYYFPIADTQRKTKITLELRDTLKIDSLILSEEVELDSTGWGVIKLNVSGSYYVVVKKINHLASITQEIIPVKRRESVEVDFSVEGVGNSSSLWEEVNGSFSLRGGDLDSDGVVFISDYTKLGQNWGSSEEVGDIDGDGNVFISDYNILALNWGAQSPVRLGNVEVVEVGVMDISCELGFLPSPDPQDFEYNTGDTINLNAIIRIKGIDEGIRIFTIGNWISYDTTILNVIGYKDTISQDELANNWTKVEGGVFKYSRLKNIMGNDTGWVVPDTLPHFVYQVMFEVDTGITNDTITTLRISQFSVSDSNFSLLNSVITQEEYVFKIKKVAVEEQKVLPTEFEITKITPTPFKDEVCISYSVDKEMEVEVKIYDLAGKLVKRVRKGRALPGIYTVKWKGEDEGGNRVSAGVYFLHIIGDKKLVKKLIIVSQ